MGGLKKEKIHQAVDFLVVADRSCALLGVEVFFDPAEDRIDDRVDFVFGQLALFFKSEEFGDAIAVIASTGVLRNKNGVSLGWGLSSVVFGVGWCQPLVYEVGSMQAQDIHATGGDVFLFRLAQYEFFETSVLLKLLFERVPVFI